MSDPTAQSTAHQSTTQRTRAQHTRAQHTTLTLLLEHSTQRYWKPILLLCRQFNAGQFKKEPRTSADVWRFPHYIVHVGTCGRRCSHPPASIKNYYGQVVVVECGRLPGLSGLLLALYKFRHCFWVCTVYCHTLWLGDIVVVTRTTGRRQSTIVVFFGTHGRCHE